MIPVKWNEVVSTLKRVCLHTPSWKSMKCVSLNAELSSSKHLMKKNQKKRKEKKNNPKAK